MLSRRGAGGFGSNGDLGAGGIDDPQGVFPSHIGVQAAHVGHPILRGLVQALHVTVPPSEPHLSQRCRIFGAKAGIASDRSFGTRRRKPGFGAFADLLEG